MEITNNSSKLPPIQKTILIVGVVVFAITVCFVLPYESSKTNMITELVFTYLGLGISLLFLMYGLMGDAIYKGLLLLLASTIIGFFLFYLGSGNQFFNIIIAFILGIPTGICTALAFLIFNYTFLNKQQNYKLAKQIGLYIFLLLLIAALFKYGGDWIFEFSQYLKGH